MERILGVRERERERKWGSTNDLMVCSLFPQHSVDLSKYLFCFWPVSLPLVGGGGTVLESNSDREREREGSGREAPSYPSCSS